MHKGYSVETLRQVWDDEHGEVICEVGPDSDALQCVQISRRESMTNRIIDRIVLPPEAAMKLAEAIEACAREMFAAASVGKLP